MTGGISVTHVHGPRASQKRHIDADAVIKGVSARTAKVFTSCRNDPNKVADEQDSIVVYIEQAAFCSKIGYVCTFGPRMRGNLVAKSEG